MVLRCRRPLGATPCRLPQRSTCRFFFVSQPSADEAAGRDFAKLGFPAIPVDRDDVVALYRVASEAQAHARRGNGRFSHRMRPLAAHTARRASRKRRHSHHGALPGQYGYTFRSSETKSDCGVWPQFTRRRSFCARSPEEHQAKPASQPCGTALQAAEKPCAMSFVTRARLHRLRKNFADHRF